MDERSTSHALSKVSPTPLDRYVPVAMILAGIAALLIIFFGRW